MVPARRLQDNAGRIRTDAPPQLGVAAGRSGHEKGHAGRTQRDRQLTLADIDPNELPGCMMTSDRGRMAGAGRCPAIATLHARETPANRSGDDGTGPAGTRVGLTDYQTVA